MSDTPPSAASLADVAATQAKKGKGPPPVHLWDPPHTGDIDIRIARDGTWFHEGTVIEREALVRLFASILKREGDRHFLVTPVEKVGIVVEDAPFLAIDMERGDDALTFETNVGDRVTAGPENAIRVEEDLETGEPSPYLHVRRGLEARIDRKTFYRLAEIAEEEGGRFVVRSRGAAFDIGPAA